MSRVIARLDGVDVPLEVQSGRYDAAIPVQYNQIFVQDGHPVVVLCHEKSIVRDGIMSRGEVLSIDAGSMDVTSRYTAGSMKVEDARYEKSPFQYRYVDGQVLHSYGVGTVGTWSFAYTQRWRADYWDYLESQSDYELYYTVSTTVVMYGATGLHFPEAFDNGP